MKICFRKPSFEIDMLGQTGIEKLKQIEKVARTCYTDNTEILTENGWINVSEITDEKVLTYNPENNKLVYDDSNMVVQDYSGIIYSSNHANLNFEVTADHRMVATKAYDGNRNYKFIEAKNLFDSHDRVRLPKFFNGSKRIIDQDFTESFTSNYDINCGNRIKEKSFSIDINNHSLIIIAAYIAEGHIKRQPGTGAGITITQSDTEELYHLVIDALNNLEWSYRVDTDPRKPYIKFIHINGGLPITYWFEENCGRYSKNKHMPIWFRQLSDRQLTLFLEILYMGDGSGNLTRNEKYLSISKQLLDEVQECFILLGRNASVGYNIDKSQYCYTEENMRDSWIMNNEHLDKIQYSGKVYCPSTTTGIICIRVNGKSMWCGNCYKSEDKITDDSYEKMIRGLKKRDHTAMFEFAYFNVKFIANRAFTHELVRHRAGTSFAQESQRYVGYGDAIEFIIPSWCEFKPFEYDRSLLEYNKETSLAMIEFQKSCTQAEVYWINSMLESSLFYELLLTEGWKPEQARDVLPNACKTEINIQTNLREFCHLLKLRTHKTASPQMLELMIPLLYDIRKLIPIIFDDINDL